MVNPRLKRIERILGCHNRDLHGWGGRFVMMLVMTHVMFVMLALLLAEDEMLVELVLVPHFVASIAFVAFIALVASVAVTLIASIAFVALVVVALVAVTLIAFIAFVALVVVALVAVTLVAEALIAVAVALVAPDATAEARAAVSFVTQGREFAEAGAVVALISVTGKALVTAPSGAPTVVASGAAGGSTGAGHSVAPPAEADPVIAGLAKAAMAVTAHATVTAAFAASTTAAAAFRIRKVRRKCNDEYYKSYGSRHGHHEQ